MLKQILKTINDINKQVKQIEQRITALVYKEALAIIMSVPGVGLVSGATILAELGEPERFSNEKAVASWAGLAPSLSQSAGSTTLGHIAKRGSKRPWVVYG
jgi:transposase